MAALLSNALPTSAPPLATQVYPTLVLRGTALYELWKAGAYRSAPPAALVDYAPVWYMLASVVALGAPAVFFVKEERLSGAGADFEFAALRCFATSRFA